MRQSRVEKMLRFRLGLRYESEIILLVYVARIVQVIYGANC